MANNSQSYWAERSRKDKIKVINTGEKGIDNLKRLLKLNLDDVEKQIKGFYDKYGDNPAEKMTYAEWEKYKARLSKMAKENPQDKTLQKLVKQNIPKYRIDRLRALELDLQMQLTEATNGQAKGIYNTLNDVSKVSQATLASRMDKTLGLTFNTIAGNKMKQILSSDWSGANWSERLWKDREKVGKKLTEVLEKGIPQGTSLQKMSRELRDLTGQSYNNAFRLIRTETSHIDGQVTLEGYKQAGEELGLEYYEYDAFLDSRTSNICRELDKKRFKVSEAEVGVNYPPMHPNCRSTTQLVLDEDYKQTENSKEEVKEETKEIKSRKYEKPISFNDLSTAQQQAVEWYVSGDGQWINNYLRGRGVTNEITHEEKTLLKALDNATKHNLPSNISKLYRSVDASSIWENLAGGGDLDYNKIEEYNELVAFLGGYGSKTTNVDNMLNKAKNAIITEKGFMSTTKLQDVALDWMDFTGSTKPVVLELVTNPNTKGIDLSNWDVSGEQQEVLLQRGLKYKILEVLFKNGQPYIKAKLI